MDILGALLTSNRRLTHAIAEHSTAAFVGHAHGGEKRPAIRTAVHRGEFQTGFFLHFPDSGLQHILSRFHKACGEFINITVDGIAELADQYNLILARSMDTVEDHTVGVVVMGDGFQLFHRFSPGSYIVGGITAIPENSILFVKIQKPVVCELSDSFDPFHGASSHL